MAGTGTQGDETVQFSRCRPGAVELRVWVDADLVNMIDAKVIARGGEGANVYRATIVTEILTPWVASERHQASVIARVAGLNPTPSETASETQA